MVDPESEIRASMDINFDLSASTDYVPRQNNALTFLGLCTTRDWNVTVPNLIRLLAQTLPGKTDSCILSTSQIWEEVYSFDELDFLADRLYLAWWVNPGGQGCFTFDELDEAFEKYLLHVCHN